MSTSIPAVDRLLATKFFVPVASQPLVARTRLTALLNESLRRRLTLVCAPAGFGKSTLLAEWVRSLPPPPDGPCVAWISLDEDDDDPPRFGDYFMSALDKVSPGAGSQALESLRASGVPDSRAGATALINRLVASGGEYVVVLDDYHFITDAIIHNGLAYLLDHLPPNIHIVISTRSEPPPSLPLTRFRARGWLQEIRTDDLRFTVEEGTRFIRYTFGLDLPDDELREVIEQTEGWPVGLQLLSLSLRGHADPNSVLEELGGTQEYILDYLIEEVLRRQPEEVQSFLLQTSILNELSGSLCDAVIGYEQQYEQSDTGTKAHPATQAVEGGEAHSQAMLRYLERSNLFLIRLDSRRQWYRYHHLFAEALRYQLERRGSYEMLFPETRQGGDGLTGAPTDIPSVSLLHERASNWYRKHGYNKQAVEHALDAGNWSLALNMIALELAQNGILPWPTSPAEPGQATDVRVAFAQLGMLPPQIPTLVRWFERLPGEVVRTNPAVCLTYALILIADRQSRKATLWLDAAEAAISTETSHKKESQQTAHPAGEVSGREKETILVWIALLRAFNAATLEEDGERALSLCDAAMAHLTPEDHLDLSLAYFVRYPAYLSLGNAVEATRSLLQVCEQTQQIGLTFLQITGLASLGALLQLQGKLHQAEETFQQAVALAGPEDRPASAASGIPYAFRADLLREWDRLDEALDTLRKGLEFAGETWFPPLQLDGAYDVMVRVRMSRGEWDEAVSALQGTGVAPELIAEEELPDVTRMQPAGTTRYTGITRRQESEREQVEYLHPWCADAERIRLWLARGEMDRAARWAEELVRQRQVALVAHGRPYPAQYRRDCEDMARARIALARSKSDEALEILEPVAGRAEEGGRVTHLIEIKLLQALAYGMHSAGGQKGHKDERALALVEEAVRLGEDGGFTRGFLDEGAQIAFLLSQLCVRRREGPSLQAGTISYIEGLLTAFGNNKGTRESSPSSATGYVLLPIQARGRNSGATDQMLVEPLSERELEVLHLLAQGASNAEIAEQLVLAINTVKRHMSNIFEKLGASNRTQAVAQARSLGLIADE